MQPAGDTLTPAAHAALARAAAKPLSYGVRALEGPGENPRLVVLLGEAHLKLGTASALGKDVVEQIALRGVETFQSKHVFAGPVLKWLIYFPRILLRIASLGLVKDSTIVDAKQASHGFTVEIERAKHMPLSLHVASLYMTALFSTMFAHVGLSVLRLFVPGLLEPLFALSLAASMAFQTHMIMLVPALLLRRFSWSWVLHPMAAILTARDTLMVAGTVRMLADHPAAGPALVILGRAHLPGCERILIEEHGFRRVALP